MSRTATTLLKTIGLQVARSTPVYRNLSYPDIRKHEIGNNEGEVSSTGAFCCDTGIFTGRSPRDKYIVQRAPSESSIWWGPVNQPCTPAVFDHLWECATEHYRTEAKRAYIFDGYCGSNPATTRKVRIVAELAWQHHFVRNMFIAPTSPLPDSWEPDFTLVNACRTRNPQYQEQGLHSDCFVAFDLERSRGVIGGTWYGGEMKKGLFSMMHYWLPPTGVLTMHCAANVGEGEGGSTALFFGLSGTGKTTLSAQPGRALVGDDEHGWDENGIFNLEGGCYAKTLGLSAEREPEIYAAVRENALLENVVLNNGVPQYEDSSNTTNGRVSYPLEHIAQRRVSGCAGHPRHILFLTCDAFGVLPPVARLSPAQAMYHFLSGYTAKVAGTERGVTEPQATFSACFGAAFLPLHPTVYADVLAQKLAQHPETQVYLVNTGWTGGGAAESGGRRMDLAATRACVDAILADRAGGGMAVDPIFGFEVPQALPGVDPALLQPRRCWSSGEAYDEAAGQLAALFQENYKQYPQPGMTDYRSGGPV